LVFYRVKRVRYKGTIYYYLYKEWYDPETKRRRSKLIGRCEDIEKLMAERCGGWDLNPRRPTPSGPQLALALDPEGGFYHSYGVVEAGPISGKTKAATVCLELTEGLVEFFRTWLLREEGTSERTVRDYVGYLRKALGLRLCGKEDVSRFFTRVGLNKRSFEAFRRLLTYVERKLEGYDYLVLQLRKALPRKPKSAADTYVPEDSRVLQLRDAVTGLGEPYRTIYNILVSTGCRLSEALAVLQGFDRRRLVKVSEEVYRYHADLQRKSKNVLVLYLPKQVVEAIEALDTHVPHKDNVAKVFESLGLPAKYVRKWYRQTLKRLRVDPEVIEFLQGRVSALGVGAKHYTDFIPLADAAYTETIYPHIKQYLT